MRKAIVQQVNMYSITLNGQVFDGFKFDGEWNGMMQFTGPLGTIILDNSLHDFENIFEDILDPAGHKRLKPAELPIIKASATLKEVILNEVPTK